MADEERASERTDDSIASTRTQDEASDSGDSNHDVNTVKLDNKQQDLNICNCGHVPTVNGRSVLAAAIPSSQPTLTKQTVMLNQRSMQPTLNPDTSMLKRDIVLLDRLAAVELSASHGKTGLQIGDVVAVKSPINPRSLVIKRVIGLPNSIVKTLDPSNPTIRVPPGHIWIEGDEPFHSRDSNSYGPVALGLVDSKVNWILWPPNRLGKVAKAPTDIQRRSFQPRNEIVV
ncbi:hypothetical protein OIO90_001221 [Microbotryomycetes sp. JL221]|nr:hypothetical protein OIO90_001221 [Microbotryomycetes sp. JL221]